MKNTTRPLCHMTIAVVAIALSLASPAPAGAQQGANAVYPAGGGACCTPSPSFLDASAFLAQNNNTVCSVIYNVLKDPNYLAAVIDARSLNTNPNVSMTCANGTTPWNNGSGLINKPSTILLPSGVISTFSFFTTSPHAPSWATGKTYPGNSIPCAQGSIYSCTGTSSNCNNKALWGCPNPGGNWQGIL